MLHCNTLDGSLLASIVSPNHLNLSVWNLSHTVFCLLEFSSDVFVSESVHPSGWWHSKSVVMESLLTTLLKNILLNRIMKQMFDVIAFKNIVLSFVILGGHRVRFFVSTYTDTVSERF